MSDIIMISTSDESLMDSFPERYRKSNFRMFPVSPTVHLEEYVDWRTLAMREVVRSSDGESVADFEKRKQRMLGYIGRNNDLMTTIREEVSPEMKAKQLAVSIENKRQQFLNKVVQQMEGKTEDQDAIKQKPATTKKWKPIPIRPHKKPGNKLKDPKKADKVVPGRQNTSSVLKRASAPSTVKPFKLLPPIGIEKKGVQDLGVNGQEEKKVKRDAIPIRHTKKSAQMANQMKAKINPETVHMKSVDPRTSHALTDLVPGSSSKKKRHKASKPDIPRNNSSYSTLYDLPKQKVTSTFPGLTRALPPIGRNDKKPGRISSCDVRKSERLKMSVSAKDNTSSNTPAVFKSVTCTEDSSSTPALSARSSAHSDSLSSKDSSTKHRRFKADKSTESVKASQSGRYTQSPSSSKRGVGSVIYNTPSGSTRSVPGSHSDTPTQSNKAPSVNSARSSKSSASIASTNSVGKGSHDASISGLNNGNTNVKEPPDIPSLRSVSPLSMKSRRSITDILPPVGMAKSSTSTGITSKASNVKPKGRPNSNKCRDATSRASTANLRESKGNISRGASRTTTATLITARPVSRSTITTPRPVSRSTTTTPRPVSRSTAITPRPVSRSTDITPRPLSRATTTTTTRPVSRSTTTSNVHVSRSTSTTPRSVSRTSATAPRPVSRTAATAPRPVSRSTTATPRPVSRSMATTHIPVSRSSATAPRPVSHSLATTPRSISSSVITTPVTKISITRSKSTAEARRNPASPNSSVTGKSASR